MSLYQKLRFENSNNQENLSLIESAADQAITYTAQHCEYALNKIWVNDDGFLTLDFVPGQKFIEAEVAYELQGLFEEKFASIINIESPEVR